MNLLVHFMSFLSKYKVALKLRTFLIALSKYNVNLLKWKINFVNFPLFFRFEQLRENLRVKEDNTSNYEYDNSTSEECNELMEWMESGTFTNIIWSIFKVTMLLFHNLSCL